MQALFVGAGEKLDKKIIVRSYAELDSITYDNAKIGYLYLLLDARDYDDSKHPSKKGTIEILLYGDSVTIQRMTTLNGLYVRYNIGGSWNQWNSYIKKV